MKHLIYTPPVIALLLTGCSYDQPTPKANPVQILYKVKKVYVEVPCKVPAVNCDFTGIGNEPIIKLLKCVVDQKKALDYCSNLDSFLKEDAIGTKRNIPPDISAGSTDTAIKLNNIKKD